MEGEKNDRPKWINNVFRQTAYDIIVNNRDPIINLKKAIYDLELGNVNPELLKRSTKLSKTQKNTKIKMIANARLG
jgi:hypothetical protein